MTNKKSLVSIYILLLAGILAYYWISSSGIKQSSDFTSFVASAKLLQANPRKLYDLTNQKDEFTKIDTTGVFVPFRGTPIIAAIFLPFLSLNIEVGYLVWTGVNIALIAIAGYLFEGGKRNVASFVLFSLLYFPITHTLKLGQVSIIFLVLFGLFYFLEKKQKYLPAGIALGALLMRPGLVFTILLFLFLVKDLGKNWKPLALGIIISAIAIFFANVMLFQDTQIYTEFLDLVKYTNNSTFLVFTNQQFSIFNVLNFTFSMGTTKAFFFNGLICTILIVFLQQFRNDFEGMENFGLLVVTLGIVLSLQATVNSLALIYPFVFKVAKSALKNNDRKKFYLGLFSYSAPFVATGVIGRVLPNAVLNIGILMISTYLLVNYTEFGRNGIIEE